MKMGQAFPILGKIMARIPVWVSRDYPQFSITMTTDVIVGMVDTERLLMVGIGKSFFGVFTTSAF